MNCTRCVLIILGMTVILFSTLSTCMELKEKQSVQKRIADLIPKSKRIEPEFKVNGHDSAIIRVMEKFTDVMQVLLKVLDNNAKVDDVVRSVQDLFTSIEELLNVKTLLNEFPVVGPIISTIISPILDFFSSIVKDTPAFGGLLSQIFIGPEYPVTLPPPPPTTQPPPTTAKAKFGIFG